MRGHTAIVTARCKWLRKKITQARERQRHVSNHNKNILVKENQKSQKVLKKKDLSKNKIKKKRALVLNWFTDMLPF